jgi:hypothetical protein
MRHVSALPIVVVATALPMLAADELPPTESDQSFEIEPPLLIQTSPAERQQAATASQADPIQLEKDLKLAKRNAALAKRLCEIGALSRLEAEQRVLKVVRLESDLANVQVARAKEELLAQQTGFAAGAISRDEVEVAKAALAQSTAAAEVAAAKRQQAELAAAEINLNRQKKLLALGSSRKSDVSRAERRLAEIKAQKN